MTTVRKAYKKKALKTHPDRLPAGASDEDKSAAAEEFRIVSYSPQHHRSLTVLLSVVPMQVNNAYEVLCDPEKRRVSLSLHAAHHPLY